MYSTPCNSGFSCKQCLSVLHSVWVQLENSSKCCYNSPSDVDDSWLTMTSDVGKCPLNAYNYQALAIGIVFGLVCLLALLGVIVAQWKGLLDCSCCCRQRVQHEDELLDDDESPDSGRSSPSLNTTTDEEGCQARVMKFMLRATSFASAGNYFSPISNTSTTQGRSSSMGSLLDLDTFAPTVSPITPAAKSGEEASGGSSGEDADQSGNCDTSANTSANSSSNLQDDWDRVYQCELAKAAKEKAARGLDELSGENGQVEDDWEPMYVYKQVVTVNGSASAKDEWDLMEVSGENAAANESVELEHGQEAEIRRLLGI